VSKKDNKVGAKRTSHEVFEAVPHISMRPQDKYKVATSSYERLLDVGPLTDEAILRYEAQGRYGEARQLAAQAVLDAREERRLVRLRDTLDKDKAARKLEKRLSTYE
jgi:hypothetical protein